MTEHLVADASTSPPPRTAPARFRFAYDAKVAPVGRAFGVDIGSSYVEVTESSLEARFGPWTVRTPITNVVGAQITGPYRWWKVAGPAHLSVADLGLTFGTTTAAGVCITFAAPVRGIDPFGLIPHPALTVTVEDPEGLCDALQQRIRNAQPNVDAGPAAGTRARLVQGAMSGVVATSAMTVVMTVLRRAGFVDKVSPRVITEAPLPAPLTHAEPVVSTATLLSHFGYGVANGALFGIVAPRLPGPRVARGIAFAGALMLASYEGWVPAANILPPQHRQDRGRAATLALGHLVYGSVLGRLTRG